MEAPLGASALMHSSTLVVAGLVLLYRLSIFIELSGFSQVVMFILGIFSAVCGSILACYQFELKAIMAYSTISNMGYMFLLFSLGAYYELIIVIILHAYIKIFMFLLMGGIILHCNGCQDIR
jgi:NADH:ubiquinone oxidoreductase subunit 5 (subunit L)/multisubunit Na+/H+ antiporter MnhA subunit